MPEFATNGKHAVTVEHVLTHTAGFPYAPLGYPKMCERDQRLAAFGRWRLDSVPGTRFQFHLTSAAWVIAELVERRTGMTFADYLHTWIAAPLGLPSIELGVPLERQAATVAPMLATDRTGDDDKVDPWGPWYLSDPQVLAAGEPSHSLVAPPPMSRCSSRRWSTPGCGARRRCSRDRHCASPRPPPGRSCTAAAAPESSMGLFVTVAGPDAGGPLPSTGSATLFGNSGAAYQTGFMDPETGLSFAWLCNGYPLAGYDRSRRGTALQTNVANLAADLVR